MGHDGNGASGSPHDLDHPPTPPHNAAQPNQPGQQPVLPVMRQAGAQAPGQPGQPPAGAPGYPPYAPYPPYPPYYPQPGYPAYPGYPAPGQYPPPGQQGYAPQGYAPAQSPQQAQPGAIGVAAPPTVPFPQAPTPPAPRKPIGRRVLIGSGMGMALLIVLLIVGVVVYSFVGAIAYHVGPFVVGPYERISGVIYGQSLADVTQGAATPAMLPVAASVTCAGVMAHANAQGAYALSLPAAANYTCVATAPNYAPQTIQLTGHGAQAITLNIGPKTTSACPPESGRLSVTCAAMTLAPATLTGVVTDVATGQGIPDASVSCWNDDAALITSQRSTPTLTTTADGTGAYTLHGLAPSHYACAADQTGALTRFSVTAGQSMRQNFAVCTTHCPGLVYHGGQIMHTNTAFVVFWLPKGQTFAPGKSDANFESLVQQYFKDVGGTSFYHQLTQYWDSNGPVRNVEQFGGSYVDTTPYPHLGTTSDPLTDTDIQDAVSRAIAANHWPDNHQTDEVFVVTGYNVAECAGATCNFPKDATTGGFCGYHDVTADGTIYTFVGDSLYNYVGNYVYSCVPASFGPYGPTPNDPIIYGNAYADSVINVLSHEQFESVTDPFNASGWTANSRTEGENGDLCFTTFGRIDSQGATVTLAHGHGYNLQEEFSNLTNGCSYT